MNAGAVIRLIFQCRLFGDDPVAPRARPAPPHQRSPRTPELHRSVSRKRNCRSAAQPARAGRSDRPARLAHEDSQRVRLTLLILCQCCRFSDLLSMTPWLAPRASARRHHRSPRSPELHRRSEQKSLKRIGDVASSRCTTQPARAGGLRQSSRVRDHSGYEQRGGDGTSNRAIGPAVTCQVRDFRARDLILAWHTGDVWT
jgi:hypothetical protein